MVCLLTSIHHNLSYKVPSVMCKDREAPDCKSCLVRETVLDPDGCAGDCTLDSSHHCVPSRIQISSIFIFTSFQESTAASSAQPTARSVSSRIRRTLLEHVEVIVIWILYWSHVESCELQIQKAGSWFKKEDNLEIPRIFSPELLRSMRQARVYKRQVSRLQYNSTQGYKSSAEDKLLRNDVQTFEFEVQLKETECLC